MERPKTLIATEDMRADDAEPGHVEVINGAAVCVRAGEKLNPEERQAIAEYIDFCRDRARERLEKAKENARRPQ